MNIEDIQPRQSGGWFEDQVLVRRTKSATRTTTEYEIGAFAGLTGDFCDVHTFESFASQSECRSRIAHGMLNLIVSHGLLVRTGLFERIGLALLGWDKVPMMTVVRIGDTVQANWELGDLRESRSRPAAGIVCDHVLRVNQHGATVFDDRVSTLVAKRPPSSSSS